MKNDYLTVISALSGAVVSTAIICAFTKKRMDDIRDEAWFNGFSEAKKDFDKELKQHISKYRDEVNSVRETYQKELDNCYEKIQKLKLEK